MSHGGPKTAAPSSPPNLYAIIDYPDPYVQPLILHALKSQLHNLPVELISSIQQLPSPDSPLLQFTAYESLDFEHAMIHPSSSLICAYVIRKALIRKHYLSNTISTWLVKHPGNGLAKHFKPAVHFELDYAEFLDEALVDAWELNSSLVRNEQLGEGRREREWWILKPGMTDGGNGIRLFSSMTQLQRIFEEWEEEDESEEEKEEGGEEKEGEEADGVEFQDESKEDAPTTSDGVMTSQLRHFIAQPYIDPPLLLHRHGNRKFHIRVYVLATGALNVYVYREMLALFAALPYQSPPSSMGDEEEQEGVELAAHLTNTCFQDDPSRADAVVRFWELDDDATTLAPDWKERVFEQICWVTGEVFEAAAREQMVHFQTLPNAFEVYGVDFLVDAACHVWLLELNAYPDFRQTGTRLQDQVVGGLFRQVVRWAVQPFFGGVGVGEGGDSSNRNSSGRSSGRSSGSSGFDGGAEMVAVRCLDLGRR